MSHLSLLQLGSPLSYLLAISLPALDAIMPVVPSETVIIALGVATAGSTDPRIGVLVALAAVGAFLGDNGSYLLGRHFGPRVHRRFFSTERGANRRAWTERALRVYGARLILVCRFIPGGRTAVTLTCGLVGYHRRTFIAATAVAGVVWACYAFFIGRLGGTVFRSQPWVGFFVALAAALVVSALVEVGRRARSWLRVWRRRAT